MTLSLKSMCTICVCCPDYDPLLETKEQKTWRGKSKPANSSDAPIEEQGRAPRPTTPVLPALRLPDATSDASPGITPRRMGDSSPRLTPRQSIQRFLGGLIPGKSGRHSEGERTATPEGSTWPTLSPESEPNASTTPMAAGTPLADSLGGPAAMETECHSTPPISGTINSSASHLRHSPPHGHAAHGLALDTKTMQLNNSPSPLAVSKLTPTSVGKAEQRMSPSQEVDLARVSPIVANLAAQAQAIRAKQKAQGGTPSPTTRPGRRAFSPLTPGQSPLAHESMGGTPRGDARWTPTQAARMQENLNTNCLRLQGLDSPGVVQTAPQPTPPPPCPGKKRNCMTQPLSVAQAML
jgi:hypothetical protein